MKSSFYKFRRAGGITLVELLVSVIIVAVLTAILLPVFSKARRKAKAVENKNNQRQIVMILNLFAQGNDGKYPESVATGGGEDWHWADPRLLVSKSHPEARKHRAVSEYLAGYVQNISTMYCPSCPEKPESLKEIWQARDDWDNSQTPEKEDIFVGSYCFYWNYTGYIEGKPGPFKGPENQQGRGSKSRLLVSDYFGYGHWLWPKSYTSCEHFRKANKSTQTTVYPSLWSSGTMEEKADAENFDVQLNAGFTDGHVESYQPGNSVIMRVSQDKQGQKPWPDGIGAGEFYLPPSAIE